MSEHHRPDLSDLIKITQNLVTRDEGIVQIVSAMAQRANALVKIQVSAEVGMKRYWQGLASSANFGGSTLEKCLDTIHCEITDSWNFDDPHEFLIGQAFREQLKALAQLAIPDESSARSWFPNLDNLQNLVGMGSLVVAGAAPIVAGVTLSAMGLKFFGNMYSNTPEALRCLMAYIVDLTLVLDHLFLVVVVLKPPRRLTSEHVDIAINNYRNTDAGEVHRKIRQYANEANLARIIHSDTAHSKVMELIKAHRADRTQTAAERVG